MITVKTRLLHPDARLPTYGSVGAACFDFYAYVPNKSTLMLPNERAIDQLRSLRDEVESAALKGAVA